MIKVFDQRSWLNSKPSEHVPYWDITDFLIKNKKCWACKKKLPDNYQHHYCCDGFQCGCFGRPIEPGHCDNEVCKELVFNYNYREYAYMWE